MRYPKIFLLKFSKQGRRNIADCVKLIALIFATVFIFIRSCFRVAELSGGFGSALANDQITFMILEGAMIVSACLCLTLFHPGRAFAGGWKSAGYTMRAGGEKN